MNTTYETKDFTFSGLQFRAEFSVDAWTGEPWKEEDGHGDVTDWETRAKRPGELVLSESRGHRRYYDFAGAVLLAKRDGWRSREAADHHWWSDGEVAHHAAMADFERLRAWCNGEWFYCTITVFPLTAEGDELISKACSMGGLASDEREYHELCLLELAAEVLESHPELIHGCHA